MKYQFLHILFSQEPRNSQWCVKESQDTKRFILYSSLERVDTTRASWNRSTKRRFRAAGSASSSSLTGITGSQLSGLVRPCKVEGYQAISPPPIVLLTGSDLSVETHLAKGFAKSARVEPSTIFCLPYLKFILKFHRNSVFKNTRNLGLDTWDDQLPLNFVRFCRSDRSK